jgi:hypothetical protein
VPNDEPQVTFEQPRSMFSTWIGVLLLFCFFAILVWAVMGAMPRGDRYEQTRAQGRLEKLKTANEEAETALHKYGWVDKEKGVVRMPISRAMEVSVAELAQRKPAPANPIDPAAGEKAGLQVTAPMGPSPAPVSTPPPDAASSPKATAVSGPDSENRGQPAAANNPPDAAPGTQPGPEATAAASPPAPSGQPPAKDADRGPTPVQNAPGPALPVPGRDPMPSASPEKQP